MALIVGKRLDALDRCCGAVTLPCGMTHRFCERCRASFDPRTRRQIANEFWELRSGHMLRVAAEVGDGEQIPQA